MYPGPPKPVLSVRTCSQRNAFCASTPELTRWGRSCATCRKTPWCADHSTTNDPPLAIGHWLLKPPSIQPSFVPAKCVFKMQQFRLLAGQEIYADDVEARLRRRLVRQLTHVLSCHTAQSHALVLVDCRFGGRGITCCSCLHFEEAKQRSLPRHEIQVSRQIAC